MMIQKAYIININTPIKLLAIATFSMVYGVMSENISKHVTYIKEL